MQELCKDLDSFLLKTGFDNLDKKDIERAFVHPSYTKELSIDYVNCYERLEFLGDAVLKLIISDLLYKKFPNYKEGQMTNLRAILVSDEFLFNLAEDLDLKSYIRMSKALENDGGRNIPSISACVFEAFLGALHENSISLDKISKFLEKLYSKYINNLDSFLPQFNAKATLQEYTQSLNKDRPEYLLISQTGSDNNTYFTVNVIYNGEILGIGQGKSKKQAEREAAYQACIKLKLIGEK